MTTQLHQEEVESSDDVQMIEQIEQIETEIEEEETEEETVFTLDLTDDSECEDKEYLGKKLKAVFHRFYSQVLRRIANASYKLHLFSVSNSRIH